MGEEITVYNGRISDFQGLITLTVTLDLVILHTIMHQSSTLWTATYCQHSHVKQKLGQKSKIRLPQALGIVPLFKNP